MTLWPGTCIVHEQFSERELIKLKVRHPDALVAAHPECPTGILAHADHVGSTRAILEFVLKANSREFLIATERHIIHQMEKAAPDKVFIPVPGADGGCSCSSCPFMARNTMEKVYLTLLNNAPRIELPEPLRLAALKPLQKMLDMSLSVPIGLTSTRADAIGAT
jgi:quinolinate synthase